MKRLIPLLLLITACGTGRTGAVYFPSPQGRIHVDDGGTGPKLPLMFIHGNGGNLTQWQAQLAHFRKTRRAVAMDLRGMGISDPPANGEYTIEAMADDIHDVANSLGLDRFVIVGHSFGAAVVARYAAKYPERIAGVVYADAAGDVTVGAEQAEKFLTALRMDKKKVAGEWFEPILREAKPEVKALVLLSVDRTSTEAFTESLEEILTFQMKKNVEAYRGPKLAIAAASSEKKTALHVQLPSIPSRTISGVSHWLMMDRPEEFNRQMEIFLAEIEK